MNDFEGLLELANELEDIMEVNKEPQKILAVGAKLFVSDLLKLPKPKSKIRSAKHTHLVDSFSYQESRFKKGEIEVGWGKYYGRMVEEGTVRMGRQPHLKPLFNMNRKRYMNAMLKEAKLN